MGSKMLHRQQKASSRNTSPSGRTRTYCHKQWPTGRKKKKSTQVCTCLRVCSIHCTRQCTPREKNFISKSIFLLKRMLFAKQHCHWPPVPNFDHKHAMSDTASYANSHHTLKKKKGKRGREREGRGMLHCICTACFLKSQESLTN